MCFPKQEHHHPRLSDTATDAEWNLVVKNRLMRIAAQDMDMRSCSRCDMRFWQLGGEEVELSDVLGREPARQPALR